MTDKKPDQPDQINYSVACEFDPEGVIDFNSSFNQIVINYNYLCKWLQFFIDRIDYNLKNGYRSPVLCLILQSLSNISSNFTQFRSTNNTEEQSLWFFNTIILLISLWGLIGCMEMELGRYDHVLHWNVLQQLVSYAPVRDKSV
ncbi:MAG: hypothetical protein EBQ92_13310 [Proteobacteria bacterium]|nr:hypothetical protein [Pseudomonadota bacterium]